MHKSPSFTHEPKVQAMFRVYIVDMYSYRCPKYLFLKHFLSLLLRALWKDMTRFTMLYAYAMLADKPEPAPASHTRLDTSQQ
jgi:hypothetical protein